MNFKVGDFFSYGTNDDWIRQIINIERNVITYSLIIDGHLHSSTFKISYADVEDYYLTQIKNDFNKDLKELIK